MTEPQVWTLIGVFAAALFAMLTIVSTLFLRVLRAELGGVRVEMDSLRTEMNARFDAVDARFDAVNTRIDGLDRDVQALVKHTFGLDRD